MRKQQTAFTLVEMLAVVAVLALTVILATPAVFEEARFREVGDALSRAGAIAAAIETGRSLGVITPNGGPAQTLGAFIGNPARDEVTDFMSSINTDAEVLGSSQKELYRIKVGQYSVEVSFTVVGDEYSDFVFPSTKKVPGTQNVNGVDVATVTWTVGPKAEDGLSIAHMTNHYMNNGI